MSGNGEIKVGDLVMVVKGTECCGICECLGYTFRVEWVGVCTGECQNCGDDGEVLCADDSPDSDEGFPMSLLRRIDPPATGEYDGVPVRKTESRKLSAKQPTKETV